MWGSIGYQPGGEEEHEGAAAGAAGAERGAAAEAAAGDGGHHLAHEQQGERGAAHPRGRVRVVHAVGPLAPRVRLQARLRHKAASAQPRWAEIELRERGGIAQIGTYRGAALLGADGEAECDEVDEHDGGQHRVGAGHGGVGSLAPQAHRLLGPNFQISACSVASRFGAKDAEGIRG